MITPLRVFTWIVLLFSCLGGMSAMVFRLLILGIGLLWACEVPFDPRGFACSESNDCLESFRCEDGRCVSAQQEELSTDADGITEQKPDGITEQKPDGITEQKPDGTGIYDASNPTEMLSEQVLRLLFTVQGLFGGVWGRSFLGSKGRVKKFWGR
ncbi:MAG: hypothetical protein AAGJ35_04165 [Myxococcota bacterium]